jgi:hypothetical protein
MKKWFDDLEKDIVKWLVGLFLTGVGLSIPFYFTTTNTMAQHTQKLNDLTKVVESSDNALNVWKINKLEVTSQEQKADIKELKHEFTEFQKQYAKDREEILKLLYEIKKK